MANPQQRPIVALTTNQPTYERTTKLTNAQSEQRTDERTNEFTNEQTNERANDRTSMFVPSIADERTNDHSFVRSFVRLVDGRTNEQSTVDEHSLTHSLTQWLTDCVTDCGRTPRQPTLLSPETRVFPFVDTVIVHTQRSIVNFQKVSVL